MTTKYITAKPRVEEVDDDYVPPPSGFGGYLRDVPYSQEKKPDKKKYGGNSNYVEVNTTDENLRFHVGGSTFNMSYDEAADLTQNAFLRSNIFKKISSRLSANARANFALGVTVAGAAIAAGKFAYDWYHHTPGTWGNIIGTAIENIVQWVRNVASKVVNKVKGWFGVKKTSAAKPAQTSGTGAYQEVVGPDGLIYMIPVKGVPQKSTAATKTPGVKQTTQTFMNNMKKLYNEPLTPSAKKQAEAIGKIAKKADVNVPKPGWLLV